MPSRADRVAVIACGALAQDIGSILDRTGWAVDVYPLPPLLHNRPERIAAAVEETLDRLADRYDRIVIAYADCGTYGALDEVCARRGVQRLPGLHCYDLYAGPERLRELFAAEPGTYLLTDFLVRSFDRTVMHELGLDRHPELRDTYFGNYTRVVWLAQRPNDELRVLATRAAAVLGLPLSVLDAGQDRLAAALAQLFDDHDFAHAVAAKTGDKAAFGGHHMGTVLVDVAQKPDVPFGVPRPVGPS